MGWAELRDLSGIAISAMEVEPRGSSKWAVAGKIRKGRQITVLNL
jgi:hypothetical protein